MSRTHSPPGMTIRRRPGSIVVKQQRDEDLDYRPAPWAVVVKVEKPPSGDGWRGSSVAPGLLAPEDVKPMVVPVFKQDAKPWADEKKPVYKQDAKPWADEKKPVTRDFKVKPLPTTSVLNLPSRDAAPRPVAPENTAPIEPETAPVEKIPDLPEGREVLMLPPTSESGAWRERVCAQNYAAMDAESGAYGLIGVDASLPAPGGVRSLVMHVPRKAQHRGFLAHVRPGSILKVRRTSRRGQPDPPIQELRVRFTTPARYYGPGSNVTTLGIGVDEAEWQGVLG